MEITTQSPVTIPAGTTIKVEATDVLVTGAIRELDPLELIQVIKQCIAAIPSESVAMVREFVGSNISAADTVLLDMIETIQRTK